MDVYVNDSLKAVAEGRTSAKTMESGELTSSDVSLSEVNMR